MIRVRAAPVFGSCGFAGNAPAWSNATNESSPRKTSKNVAGQSRK
jgi:hypothetical protein